MIKDSGVGFEIYQGNAAELLDALQWDAMIGDPPWGVNGGVGANARRGKTKYNTDGLWEDTPDYVAEVIVPIVQRALARCERGAITPGIRMAHSYPQPRDMGCFWQPSSIGRGPWGFGTFSPIYYYGKDPRRGKGSWPTGKEIVFSKSMSDSEHPCPKPLEPWIWLVEKVSLPGEVVFDPFMGTGVTGVAALLSGRRFVGIDLVPAYYQEALVQLRRAEAGVPMGIRRESGQLDLFTAGWQQ